MSRWLEKLLVRRIRSGDREACAELVRAHQAAIFRFLYHLCGDVHAAEDLTQETFAAGWSRIETFRGAASLATWLDRIAYCKYVDWLRKSRPPAADCGNGPDVLQDHEPGPLDGLLADERARQLYGAVAALDRAEREVIALHYFQQLTFREMAEILGQPAGTVKWRTNSALEKLREMLGRFDDERRSGSAKAAGGSAAGAAAAASPPAA